jgi:hypothetical protein
MTPTDGGQRGERCFVSQVNDATPGTQKAKRSWLEGIDAVRRLVAVRPEARRLP